MDFFSFLLSFQLTKHNWHLIDNKHWQIVDSQTQVSSARKTGACFDDQVEIKGWMKQDFDSNPWGGKTVEHLQKTTCTKWINRDFPERCAEFDREKWLNISKDLPIKFYHFCVDTYEFPNKKGEYPLIYVNYDEAQAMCSAHGKRLCDEEEWTFACEGEEAMPYPYGYVRDATACNIDKPYIAYHASQLRPRNAVTTMIELDRLWQGVRSGEMERCVSPFSVNDLTGGVDEWTTRVRRDGNFKSILKGGYWGRVRTRCRPSTRNHDSSHVFYQQSFRCCTST